MTSIIGFKSLASSALDVFEVYREQISSLEKKLLDTISRLQPDAYAGLTEENLYKILFMEVKDLASGKYYMDSKEPQYLAKMLEGYKVMIETLNEPLTPELYCTLHDVCSAGVITDDTPEGIPSGFRHYSDGAEAFQVILGSTLSAKGYHELLTKIKTAMCFEGEDESYPFKEAIIDPSKTIDLTGSRPSFLKLKPVSEATCRFHVEFCIKRFNDGSKLTEHEKLFACAQFVQDLDQMHVFVDGNIRTTGILMINRSLLSLGLKPCVLEDVNCLDCLSVEEIVEKIKQGQSFFASLCV